jgi:hypothetical protein
MITTEDEKKQQSNQQQQNTINLSSNEDNITKTLDQNDIKFLNHLSRLYMELKNSKLDLTQIKNNIDALQQFNSIQQYDYLNNLLYPEKCKGVKIPTPIPVPSCSFQLHNCVTLSTNSSGNLGILFNPFFLADSTLLDTIYVDPTVESTTRKIEYVTSLYINNNDNLTGSTADNNWKPINIGQVIPNVYDQYRLVSASLVIKYIGRLDIASGVLGGAIVFDELTGFGGSIATTSEIGGVSTTVRNNIVPDNLAKYGNFDLAMDSFYHQENLCLEGIRELYFPIDNSFEEYVKTMNGEHLQLIKDKISSGKGAYLADQDYVKNGFNWMVYVLGAPANNACFKLDMYLNFECLPNASFMNYLPLTLSPMGTSSDEKRKANLIIQQKPIMKSSETNDYSSAPMPSIWTKLKNKFNGYLPSIEKLISKGIINGIPGLKTGLALAGTMLNMQID